MSEARTNDAFDEKGCIVSRPEDFSAAEKRQCARLNWHTPHSWIWDGAEMECPGRYCTRGCTGPWHIRGCDLFGTTRYTK